MYVTRMKLTDLQIRKTGSPKRGQKTHFDDALPGFGLRVSQGGAKSFVVVYGKERRLKTLGRYPALGLADARKAAKKLLGDIATLDPDTPHAPRVSFDGACERFLADCAIRNKPSTVAEYRRLLRRHFDIDKALGDVNRADIMRRVEAIKGAPAERHHAFVAIRTMMNWCHKHGLIDASPVPRLSFETTTRARVLSDDELRTVWQRAEAIGHPYGTIVQLLILTGQRRGEIAALRRSWITGDELCFPVGFTKNKREHRIPIGKVAKAIIDAIPDTGDLLFPARGHTDRPFNGWSKSKRTFDKPLTIAPYTIHDLRRTFSSTMARIGTPIHVTERLLNHISGSVSGVAAVYNRYSYIAEMREATISYENFLVELVVQPNVNQQCAAQSDC